MKTHPARKLAAAVTTFVTILASTHPANALVLTYEQDPDGAGGINVGDPYTGPVQIFFEGLLSSTVYSPFGLAGATVGNSAPAVGTGMMDGILAKAQSAGSLGSEDHWGIGFVTRIVDPVSQANVWTPVGKSQQITGIFHGAKDFWGRQDSSSMQTLASTGVVVELYEQNSLLPVPSLAGVLPTARTGANQYPNFSFNGPLIARFSTTKGFLDAGAGITDTELLTIFVNSLGAQGSTQGFLSVDNTVGQLVGPGQNIFENNGYTGTYDPNLADARFVLSTQALAAVNPWTSSLSGPIQTEVGAGKTKLEVEKFYDANANGIADPNEVFIDGWKVLISDNLNVNRFTPVCLNVEPYDPQAGAPLYSVFEHSAIEKHWVNTTPTSVTNIIVPKGQTVTVMFGNVCIGAGGGHTPGFWSNRNGERTMRDGGTLNPELALLASLNLRNAAGANFDPASYSSFRTWLLDSSAVNMAYKLSSHVAAMSLNVEAGFVSGGALVHAPQLTPFNPAGLNAAGFISMTNLLTAANASLATNGLTPTGHPTRAYQEALKNALDDANNNLTFVQDCPCPFTFAP